MTTYSPLDDDSRKLIQIALGKSPYDPPDDILERSIVSLLRNAWEQGYSKGNAHNGRRDDNPFWVKWDSE